MVGEIAGLMTSLKAAKDIAETMVGLHNAAAFQEKRFELQAKLLDAQSSAFAANEERSALIEKVRSLEQEVSSLKAWETEKQRYELKDIGLGCMARVLKPDAQGTEPSHSICADCYERGKKRMLQPEMRFPGRTMVHVCHDCGSELIASGGRDASVNRGRPTSCPLPSAGFSCFQVQRERKVGLIVNMTGGAPKCHPFHFKTYGLYATHGVLRLRTFSTPPPSGCWRPLAGLRCTAASARVRAGSRSGAPRFRQC